MYARLLSMIRWLLSTDVGSAGPRVSFLVDMMEKMGCKMQPGFFSSVECEGQINGGFHLDEEGKPGVRAAVAIALA